jgi:hypothetical protein
VAVADSAALAAADADLFAKHPGQFFARIWRSYVDLQESVSEQGERLRRREALGRALDSNDARIAMDTLPEFGNQEQMRDRAQRIIAVLADIAVERFTPPGHPPVDIDASPYRLRFLDDVCLKTDVDRYQKVFVPDRFDPAPVWDALAQDWDVAKATAAIYSRAAQDIERDFGLTPDEPVERQRNGILLKHWVLVGDRWSPTSKELSYDCCRGMYAKLKALQTFALWAGDAELQARAELVARTFDYHCEITSREKRKVTARLHITTYKQQFVWWFEQGLAEQLQVFLGLYGARMRSPAIGEEDAA